MYNRLDMCAEIVAAHDLDHSDYDSPRSIHIRKAVTSFRCMQMPYNSDDEDSLDSNDIDNDSNDDGMATETTEYGMPVQPDPIDADPVAGPTSYRLPWHRDDQPVYSDGYLQQHGFVHYLNPPPLEKSYASRCNCDQLGFGMRCCAEAGGACADFLREERGMAMDATATGGGCMDPRRSEEYETAVPSPRTSYAYPRCDMCRLSNVGAGVRRARRTTISGSGTMLRARSGWATRSVSLCHAVWSLPFAVVGRAAVDRVARGFT